MDINILMVGGRRAGKTSILAAIDECCTKTFAGNSNIKVEVVKGGGNLSDKRTEMETYFTDPKYVSTNAFVPDLSPSPSAEEYIYRARIKRSSFDFNFTDMPGGVYSDGDSGLDSEGDSSRENLPELIQNNHVIIIAIDTPHMVEYPHNADGICEYHGEFNRVRRITDLIIDNFTADEDKLVIFVPLKCEKYYYNGKINNIEEYIRKGYSKLIHHFESVGPNQRFTVINNPILTLGGAEFYRFDSMGADRAVGKYCYVADLTNRRYSPQFCDDPMLLILLYMIQIAKKRKNDQIKVSRWFSEKVLKHAGIDDLLDVENELRSKLNANKPDGFSVIQDPLDIQKGSK